MNLVNIFLAIPVLVIVLIPFLKVKGTGIVVFLAVISNILLSGYFALQALSGLVIEFSFPGSLVTGPVNLRIDALSGWFIMIINFVFLTGGFYGLSYLKAYHHHEDAYRFQYMNHVLSLLHHVLAVLRLPAKQNRVLQRLS